VKRDVAEQVLQRVNEQLGRDARCEGVQQGTFLMRNRAAIA